MTQIALASNNPFKKLVESPALAAPPEFCPPPPLKSALKNNSSLPDLRPPLPLKRSPESISYLPDIRPTTPLKSALKSISTEGDLRSATSLIDFDFPKSATLSPPLRPKTPQENSRNSAPPLPTQRPATARGPSRNSAPVAPLQRPPIPQKSSHYSTPAPPAQYPTTPRHTRNSAPVLPVQPPTPSRRSYHSVPVPPHQQPPPPRKNSYSSVAPPLQRPTTPRGYTSARPSTAPPEVRPTPPFKNVSSFIPVLPASRPTTPLTGVFKAVPAPSSDIHLVLNNTSIFDPSLPEIALYELSHPLSVNSSVKIKSLILDSKGDSPKYQELYSFKCDRRGFAHVIEIQEPQKTSSLGRHKTSNLIDLRATTSIEDHRVWEVILRQPDRAIKIIQGFKFATSSAPVMWRDGKGDLLAIDSVEDPGDRKSMPMLRIVQDRDERTMDLLVVAWCARLWGVEHEIRWERELELERDKERLKIGAGVDEKVPRRSILGIKW